MTLLRVYASELGLSREEVLQMENCGLRIRTIEDFLFTDTSTFRRYCNLNDTVGSKRSVVHPHEPIQLTIANTVQASDIVE